MYIHLYIDTYISLFNRYMQGTIREEPNHAENTYGLVSKNGFKREVRWIVSHHHMKGKLIRKMWDVT